MDIDNAMSCWMSLAESIGANETEAARVWLHTLHPRYTEAHRHYHTMDHIIACINHLYEMHPSVSAGACKVDDIELALFFHDVCYDTHSHDNEQRSGMMLLGCGAAMGMDIPRLHKVFDMIMATKHTDLSWEYNDETKWLLDLDLSTLGAEPGIFVKMCQDIRKEYSWVPEDLYKPTRAKIMQGFLDRPAIYLTAKCKDRWETQARVNIAGEVARMNS